VTARHPAGVVDQRVDPAPRGIDLPRAAPVTTTTLPATVKLMSGDRAWQARWLAGLNAAGGKRWR
jgi:hypothetical protein